MAFFDAADLATFDAIRISASPDTAVISRNTGLTDDGHGGITESWTTVATVICKVASTGNTPTEQEIAGQLQGESLVTVTVPTGTDVQNDDRITIGTTVLEVVGVAPHRSFEVRRRVVCRAVS